MAQDIIDAEFETIRREDGDHPARKTPATADASARTVAEDQIDILKSATQPKAFPGRRAQIAYVLSVLFSSIAAFLVSGGHVLLRAAPTAPGELALEISADPALAAPLRADIVTVSASVRNGTEDTRRVPDVLLTFRSASGSNSLVYRVPRGETLQPGKSLAFTVRMPKKPGYTQAPSLRFDTSGV